MDLVGLSALVTSIGAALALIIKAITTSRCVKVHMPCCECVRDMSEVEHGD